MTLSVVWRSDGRLHMASDSRISFGALGSADVGVKVMRLPVRVFGTDAHDGSNLVVLFQRSYGFCYAGSFVNAGTFKSLVDDLLLDVQFVPADIQLSFDELCKFLCHFSERVSTEVVSRLMENGRYTFCIAGLCPAQERLRAAKFHLEQSEGRTVARFEEVAMEDGQFVAIGTGAAAFEVAIAGTDVTRDNILLALNRVIDGQTVPTVGGDIQYGSFYQDGNFNVSGVTRISMEEADNEGKHYGPSEQRAFRYRGWELYGDWRDEGELFWPSPVFIELNVPSNSESKERFVERCRLFRQGT